ncbi:FtsB family cell division protein [Paenilisteria rocourtiae]|uniref:Cell division protein DivIC n=1 Tax=Listeria rocourtiae TaxID=647910 RepID=A0A4R6ZLE3_9LIST|nr:septum formation initiator family protein [Listeria rocourtiae]EUJ47120.1 cell division protein DivIC [Listeria rocourtiae FSL F6-920]MBC1604377.1 septum formation initiator family protein [Listeria rocourtiae]TDR53251.1 cell division protein DivIC [Listeria rocourtiae]
MKRDQSTVTKLNNRYVQDETTMKKQQSRRRVALFRRLLMLATVMVVVSGGLVYVYSQQVSLLHAKETEKVELDKKALAVAQNQKELKSTINKLHDDDYIAKLARSEYFLSEKGEIIFNIPDENDKKKESSN